jgi:hypothetical protein
MLCTTYAPRSSTCLQCSPQSDGSKPRTINNFKTNSPLDRCLRENLNLIGKIPLIARLDSIIPTKQYQASICSSKTRKRVAKKVFKLTKMLCLFYHNSLLLFTKAIISQQIKKKCAFY